MERPFFTVAITVYQREHFLPHAIQCVLAQTDPRWEIRVLSDGPSPVARSMVEELRGDCEISYEELADVPGWHGNHLRRRALECAGGDYICFVGHDCLIYPSYLEAHANNIGGDQGVVSVVPIAYWREYRRDGFHPAKEDPMEIVETEIDLLCICYPTKLSLELDCFGVEMLPWRQADYLSFDRLRKRTWVRFRPGRQHGAHF